MNPRDDRDPVSPSEQPVAAEGHEDAAGGLPEGDSFAQQLRDAEARHGSPGDRGQ